MDAIALMASAMHAAKTRLDVSAANLANVSSDGFHKRVSRATLSDAGLVVTSAPDAREGPLRRTGRALDLATAGPGGYLIRDAAGALGFARSGSYARSASGALADERGNALQGEHGAIAVSADATIDSRGVVRVAGNAVDRVRLHEGTTLQSGFLEGANVDSVGEMVDVLAAQRAFETAQKTLAAIDDERQKETSDVARVKS
ncbi:MAG: flagellar basal body rod protein FlgF [Vulcanimicrobiaceae bacterium]